MSGVCSTRPPPLAPRGAARPQHSVRIPVPFGISGAGRDGAADAAAGAGVGGCEEVADPKVSLLTPRNGVNVAILAQGEWSSGGAGRAGATHPELRVSRAQGLQRWLLTGTRPGT